MESAARKARIRRRSAGTVVRGFFLRIGERGVGFVHLFEFGLLGLIALMSVGMEFHRLFTVCLFEFFGGSVAADAEKVVEFVCHWGNVEKNVRSGRIASDVLFGFYPEWLRRQ
ncbi:MAG: hypothetical protein QG650_914 [Patescibacteria group bacterium]|nr:hypothetical protein [Patescibacteria group bacterium]